MQSLLRKGALPVLATLGIAVPALAYQPEYFDISVFTTKSITEAILLPDNDFGNFGDYFSPTDIGPLGQGITQVGYSTEDYDVLNWMLMGTDVNADGSTGFFVGFSLQQFGQYLGKSFEDVFPGYDESTIISGFEQGVSSNGYWNNGDEEEFMYHNEWANAGNEYGGFVLLGFSNGEEIGTVSFSAPGPDSLVPFGLGLAALLRRRLKRA